MLNNKRDLDDTKMFQDGLDDNIGQLLRKFADGEPKNINPLTEIPEPQMKLYGFSGLFGSEFFDTEEELNEFVKSNDTEFGDVCTIEYLGNVANRSDVIRLTSDAEGQKLYTSVDEDGYAVYNDERSIYKGEYVWEYNYGSIRDLYTAFRNRGIVFSNDTYAKIDEVNDRVFKDIQKTEKTCFLKNKKRN